MTRIRDAKRRPGRATSRGESKAGLPPHVAVFLGRIAPKDRPLVLALRGLVRRTVPQATESVVWRSLSYHRPWVGGRVKGAICQIVVRRGLVRLDFVHGVRLPDPAGLLRGDGVSKRFVAVAAAADVARPALAALIEAAARLDPSVADRPLGRVRPRR